jgi:hypothetical protein
MIAIRLAQARQRAAQGSKSGLARFQRLDSSHANQVFPKLQEFDFRWNFSLAALVSDHFFQEGVAALLTQHVLGTFRFDGVGEFLQMRGKRHAWKNVSKVGQYPDNRNILQPLMT